MKTGAYCQENVAEVQEYGSPVIRLMIPDYHKLKHMTGLQNFFTTVLLSFFTSVLLIPSLLFIGGTVMAQSSQVIRRPAVAGQFYEADVDDLKANLRHCFLEARQLAPIDHPATDSVVQFSILVTSMFSPLRFDKSLSSVGSTMWPFLMPR